MTNDWQKIGDIAKRIVGRVLTDGPPVPARDAVLFVRAVSKDVFEPKREDGPRHKDGQAK